MILGIGTDICDIRRIERSIDKFGDKFLDKIFTPDERAYCDAKQGRASRYAKRFAAKEATAKALAGETTGHLRWRDVEVINNPSGRPTITLHDYAAARMAEHLSDHQSGHIHLSLSDDYPYATAYVIFEARMIAPTKDESV